MSTLFIHCGVHKTGTSALQAVLGVQYDALKAAGVLVPKAGRAERTGHHNIAWQLTRDRRYNPNYSGLAQLRAEVEVFDGDVVVSSEDFQNLFGAPQGFGPLLDLARDTGRDVVWIVYVRNQSRYLESLYHECLKEGFGEEFAAFAAEAAEAGMVRRREWRFHFHFARAVDKLAGLGVGRIVVRNFHALEQGSSVADFLSVLGVAPGVVEPQLLDARINEREPLGLSLQRFYANRVRRELGQAEGVAIDLLGQRIRAASCPPAIEAMMREAFGASNAMLCRRFRTSQAGLTPPASPKPRHPASLAKVFSMETHHTILRIAVALAEEGYRPGASVTPTAAREIAAWAAWVEAP